MQVPIAQRSRIMQRIAVTITVFAALIAVPVVLAQNNDWGDIKGRIFWDAKAPIPEQAAIASVNQTADKAHCLKDGPVLSENWVVNKKNRGLQWTFAWLINVDPKDKNPLPIHPALKAIPKKDGEIDQPTCAFIPHALAIREGQTLLAKNSSPVSHNIKWTGIKESNQGNVTLPAGKSVPIKLEPERLPIKVECNIHPWMNGRVGVFTHPYFALTDADGNFEIKNAPAGKYRIVF